MVENQNCRKALQTTDPRVDKKRIEETKGGLLEGSYKWVLENSDFQQWRDDDKSRLLWIKGDPGKGKTMLLCGIIDNMGYTIARDGGGSRTALSYYFCQATDTRTNKATDVLRGLIYLLVEHQPSLLSHVRERYDRHGKALFEDANAWVVLTEIIRSMMQDPHLDKGYLMIDALDECSGLTQLLDFVSQSISEPSQIKWIVSSRDWPQIDNSMANIAQKARLDLELNEDSISAAVQHYTEYKVKQLAKQEKYSAGLQKKVHHFLTANAGSTFLWVALACHELARIKPRHVQDKLGMLPPGLSSLYQRMLENTCASGDSKACRQILAVVSLSFRPIALPELTSLIELPNTVQENDLETLMEIIKNCGSFLTIRDDIVYFVHQSAKDFLLEETKGEIFPLGLHQKHQMMLSRSIEIMSRKLSRNIYNLQHPGVLIDQVHRPQPDPLAAAAYSCVNWVDHLLKTESDDYLQDEGEGMIEKFLRQHYLHWVEALSLLRCIPQGARALAKLHRKLHVCSRIHKGMSMPNIFIESPEYLIASTCSRHATFSII